MSSDAVSQAGEGDHTSANQAQVQSEEHESCNDIAVVDNEEENKYELLPDGHKRYAKGKDPMLRYLKPYWWPYRTFVKNRWIGRELLEVVSTEFRDRSVEYYVSVGLHF